MKFDGFLAVYQEGRDDDADDEDSKRLPVINHGEALKRDPERVRMDVLDGYVSREGAREDYGVVLTDDLRVDAAATAQLRGG